MSDESASLPKYYKLQLDPNYRPGMVSDKTAKSWDEACHAKVQERLERSKYKINFRKDFNC